MLVNPRRWKYAPTKCMTCGELVKLPRGEYTICSNCNGETRRLTEAAPKYMVRRGYKDEFDSDNPSFRHV